MLSKSKLLAAVAVSAGLLAAPAAQADGWHRGGWGGHGYGWGGHRYYGGYYRRGYGVGPVIGGAVLGLGAGALIAGALAPRPYYPPPVVYAPPPPVYYAPGYYGGY